MSQKIYRCVVIDDSSPVRDDFCGFIENRNDVLELVTVAENTEGLAEMLAAANPRIDLLFLDCEMRSRSEGIDFMKAHQGKPFFPDVIFISKVDERVTDLLHLDLEIVDYLGRLTTPDRFNRAIAKFLQKREGKAAAATPSASDVTARKPLRLKLIGGGMDVFVHPEEILCAKTVESKPNVIEVACVGKKFEVRESLKGLMESIEDKLPDGVATNIVHASGSTLVNKQYVTGIDRAKQVITVSHEARTQNVFYSTDRTYMERLKELFHKHPA